MHHTFLALLQNYTWELLALGIALLLFVLSPPSSRVPVRSNLLRSHRATQSTNRTRSTCSVTSQPPSSVAPLSAPASASRTGDPQGLRRGLSLPCRSFCRARRRRRCARSPGRPRPADATSKGP